VTVFLGTGVEEIFNSLPAPVQAHASESIRLIGVFPEMFAQRRRGVFKGFRYFVAGPYLFYYSVSSEEIRIIGILHGRMRRA
jgi:plasmid stabilization system protein ParE